MTLAAGCGDGGFYSGDLGVTPGGAQDIEYARAQIEQGNIPARSDFTAEGLLSQHDLPLTQGDACEQLLCPRSAVATIDPIDGGGERMLVQLGFATGLDAESFERRPLNLAVAVDISGSMADGKLERLKDALRVMTAQLDANDSVALIAFDDDASRRLKPTVMDAGGRAALLEEIDALETDGGTNIEAGLKLAYEQVTPTAGAPGVEDRVMLMTDAQPNVGATGLDSFMGMARFYAEAGVGVSVFGVGLDLGAELAQGISEVRGGNYFFLKDQDAIGRVFDDEFDYMVSPLAYDLEVTVTAIPGFSFGQAYGAPLDQPGEAVDFGASTLFLSARGGGMGVTITADDLLIPEGEADLARFAISYLPVDADERVVVDLPIRWRMGGAYTSSFHRADDLGVFKMGALLDEYLALNGAADFCAGSLEPAEALARVDEARARLDELAQTLGDDALGRERALMEKLRENLNAGASRCGAGVDDGYY
ncbi:MAG: VWA domain-containing protein [Myxococcales bacterium]|nr:VWA domain-containing protein [Myxococcales bacterium]